MVRLSFIVPFYNAEPYIEECIRSLYAQDIPQEEYEVICVDDCTPDGSRAIVERLQKEYPTLRLLVHTENKRQGGARNTGLREAKGKYVWFVDADDTIRPNSLKKLLTQAEKNDLDVLRFYFSNGGDTYCASKMVDSPIVTGSAAIFDIDSGEPLGVRCGSAVCQLIKKALLVRHDIRFAEYVQYEDDDFAYLVYAHAERVQWISVAPYIVRETQNSTIRRKTDLKKATDVYIQLIRMADMEPRLSLRDKRWFSFVEKMIVWTINDYWREMVHDLSMGDKWELYKRTYSTHKELKPYLSRKSYWRLRTFIVGM